MLWAVDMAGCRQPGLILPQGSGGRDGELHQSVHQPEEISAMMIAELIDGADFRERLIVLGVRIPDDACPETCARMAALKARETGVPGLAELVQELLGKSDVLLPSVHRAIQAHLMALGD